MFLLWRCCIDGRKYILCCKNYKLVNIIRLNIVVSLELTKDARGKCAHRGSDDCGCLDHFGLYRIDFCRARYYSMKKIRVCDKAGDDLEQLNFWLGLAGIDCCLMSEAAQSASVQLSNDLLAHILNALYTNQCECGRLI